MYVLLRCRIPCLTCKRRRGRMEVLMMMETGPEIIDIRLAPEGKGEWRRRRKRKAKKEGGGENCSFG